jgi:photosystem II stability/assembly factor-like uncharacterized protein
MKKILLVLIIHSTLYIFNCYSQQFGWIVIDPVSIPDSPDFSDLYFTNDNTGWISCSSSGNVFKTTDGGANFTTQTTTQPLNAIHMLSATEGYCGGSSGFVFRTTTGGNTWSFLGTITTTLTDISFPPGGTTGYACGDNGKIYSVTSGGVTPMVSGVVGNLSSINFPVTTEGWVCGGNVINHFTGGIWNSDQSLPPGNYNAIYFIDNQKGWAVGGKIIHTTDGENWDEQTNPDTLDRAMLDVFSLNANEGWIVGNQGLILHTTNGGTTWNVEGNGLTSALLTGVYFNSSTNGYVVGNNKTLLKYTQLTSVEYEIQKPIEFRLEQNYPNPFNPSTKIKFTIPSVTLSGVEGSFVTLKVFDVLGNEIATLVNEEKPAGTYDITWYANNLHSGVYLYQLQARDFIQTKKMILLK